MVNRIQNTHVIVGTTSTPIISQYEEDNWMILTNDSTENIYLSLSNDPKDIPIATLFNGVMLNPGEKMYTGPSEPFSGIISAISENGGARLLKCVL